MTAAPAPAHDCPLCPRLAAYREANRAANPVWFNGPVPSFGPLDARLLLYFKSHLGPIEDFISPQLEPAALRRLLET